MNRSSGDWTVTSVEHAVYRRPALKSTRLLAVTCHTQAHFSIWRTDIIPNTALLVFVELLNTSQSLIRDWVQACPNSRNEFCLFLDLPIDLLPQRLLK